MRNLRREWNEIASLDPLWAVSSRPEKKYSRWTYEEFFETGATDVSDLMARAAILGYPKGHATALDFGCGVGRLTIPLAEHFDHVYGIDISEEMVGIARGLHYHTGRVNFDVHRSPDLSGFRDGTFDMICSIFVLQHLPSRDAIKSYLKEFIRVLRSGGLLTFQLPRRLHASRILLARRRPYAFLRRIGLSPEFLYFRLGLHPMHMTAMSAEQAVRCITSSGGTMANLVPLDTYDNLYFATRA
jgi:2-polyprenyl-3-methyl-5-hydroxy-6-metoxy-1,4-benzoquinol methylase